MSQFITCSVTARWPALFRCVNSKQSIFFTAWPEAKARYYVARGVRPPIRHTRVLYQTAKDFVKLFLGHVVPHSNLLSPSGTVSKLERKHPDQLRGGVEHSDQGIFQDLEHGGGVSTNPWGPLPIPSSSSLPFPFPPLHLIPVPPYSPSLEVGPLPFPPTFPFPSPPLEVGPLKSS